jgi:hypothetical protein
MLKVVAYTPDTLPRKLAELDESQLGHLEVIDDDAVLAHIVIRPFMAANEAEICVADATREWLSRTRLPTRGAAP